MLIVFPLGREGYLRIATPMVAGVAGSVGTIPASDWDNEQHFSLLRNAEVGRVE
jgi:hypothetical protein